jgi:hypothetical protein
MTDLKMCYEAIAAKNTGHRTRWRYYEGDHPIAFLNDKFHEVIKNSVVFKKNWCQVIINTSRDRMKVQEWSAEDEGTAEAMGKIWNRALKRTATDITVSALTTGEGYLVAWPGKDGRAKAYYHDPRQMHVIYEEDDPDTPRVACKVWRSETEKATYLNLYYADRIEHYRANSADVHAHTAFQPTANPVEGNPYGAIPVFQFRPQRRVMEGELTRGVLSLQDALNKLLNDMMVTSEFASFNQRWAIGNFDSDGPLPIGPGTTVTLPPGVEGEQPVSTGVYPASNPENYLKAIGALTNDMAAISGTPRHYFEGQGANISGEALHTMEGPLIAKVEQYQQAFGETWADVMAFCLAVEGARVDRDAIECVWADPHTVQPQSRATTRKINVEAGIPIINQLRDEGWTEEQIEQLQQDALAMQPPPAPTAPPLPPRVSDPEDAAPRFDAIVQTPDIAGALASSGAITRALNRRNAN